jgi:GAF domain-containing protein
VNAASERPTNRLLTQLQTANAIMETLGVARDLATGEIRVQDDPLAIAAAVVQGMVEQLGMATASMWFFNPSDGSLELVARAGVEGRPADLRQKRLLPDDTPLGQLVRHRPPLLSNELAREPWILDPDWFEEARIVSFAGYPISFGSEPIGALTGFGREPLNPEFLEVLKFISTYTASAIANARQYIRLRHQAEREALLGSMNHRLRQAVHIPDLLQTLVDEVGTALDVDICQFLRVGDIELESVGVAPSKSIQLAPHVYRRESKDRAELLPEAHQSQPPLLGFLPLLRAIEERRSLVLADVMDVANEGSAAEFNQQDVGEALVHSSYRSLLAVPAILAEQDARALLGYLLLAQRTPYHWSSERVSLLQAIADQAAAALHKAELLEQSRQQAERQALLNRMTDRIRFSLNLDDILQAAVTEVGEALQASRAQFLFGHPSDTSATYRYAYAQTGIDSWLGREVGLRENALAAELLTDTEPIVVKVWSSLDKLPPKIADKLLAAGVQSLMAAGLYLGKDCFGVLSVHHCHLDYGTAERVVPPHWQDRRSWALEEQQLLESVAEQLAIAINQSRLYEKTQQQARREALLNEISTDIRNSLDPNQVLDSIEQALAVSLELGDCRIQLFEADHSFPPLYPAPARVLSPFPQKPAEIRIAETLSNGYPIVLSPADFDRVPPVESEFFQLERDRHLALIPLLQSGELMGTISLVASPLEKGIAAQDLSLAIAVAEQAGIALKQAQLYDQTRRLAQRESLLRQVAQQFAATYEVENILQIALECTAHALNVDRCDFITLSSQQLAEGAERLPATLQQLIDAESHRFPPPVTPQPTDESPAYLEVRQSFRRSPVAAEVLRGTAVAADLSWLLLLNCYGRRDSLLVEDVQTYPLAPQARANLLRSGMRALLAVPIVVDRDIYGILFAAFACATAGEAELESIQVLADMTAVAVQRAQFYDRARMQDAMAAAMRGLTEGREAESRRLAADLHDRTIADLGAMSRQLQQLASDSGPQLQEQRQAIAEMSEQLRETIAELRAIVEDLQPTAMRAFNYSSALRSLLERAAQRSLRHLVTRFDDRSASQLDRLPPLSQTTLFRILQEALTNIVKHAEASRVDCIISPVDETHLEVKVIDNGKGMPEHPHRVGSHGLLNMRYRADLIGATIDWRSRRNGSGTIVAVTIPLPPEASQEMLSARGNASDTLRANL